MRGGDDTQFSSEDACWVMTFGGVRIRSEKIGYIEPHTIPSFLQSEDTYVSQIKKLVVFVAVEILVPQVFPNVFEVQKYLWQIHHPLLSIFVQDYQGVP